MKTFNELDLKEAIEKSRLLDLSNFSQRELNELFHELIKIIEQDKLLKDYTK